MYQTARGGSSAECPVFNPLYFQSMSNELHFTYTLFTPAFSLKITGRTPQRWWWWRREGLPLHSPRLHLMLPSYNEVAESATAPPKPAFSSKGDIRQFRSPLSYCTNILHLSEFPLSRGLSTIGWLDSQWDGVLWHSYARPVGVVTDDGSCEAGRRIFSWDLAVVKRLIWRQREERA